MIRSKMLARTVRAILIPVAIMVAGISSAVAEEIPFPPVKEKASRIVDASITDGQSRLTISPTLRDDPTKVSGADIRSHLVALPPGTTTFELQIEGAPGAEISAPEGLMMMRGQPVIRILTSGTDEQSATITVTHNGQWDSSISDQRLGSSAMQASLGATLPATRTSVQNGSYLIIYAPAFTTATEAMVQWKTLKGYRVSTVSTGVTGASTDGIKDYIQNAYDTWDYPPEYILLVGDVDEIPTYNFHGNPSDQNYVQLEGDDFLLDAMIGRLPVENPTEAQTLVNKIINYERYPSLAGSPWQNRSLMVAGVYASDTPGYTVDFCGEMLEEIGFPAPTSVSSPPLPSLQGSMIVSSALNAGVGFVVYRGWAYGTAGWDPPIFTVDNIPGLNNNSMTPIVMSFVCLNGDYTSSNACFGEVFVRQGSPEAPGKGAVAFIGNGEHWSHTRYNDAMAISIFEKITNEEAAWCQCQIRLGLRRCSQLPEAVLMDIHCRFLPVTDAPEPRILDKQGAARYIRHMKVQLIYNPAAGRRNVADDLPPVVAFLESKGWYVSMRTTLGPGDGITYAREAVAEGYDMAVAVGGDGTLGEVATGLASSDCTLGVLPTGTGNVWAHMLGLPQWTPMSRSGLMQAARVLVEGQVYRIDLGKAGDRCFALWAGIGLDAQVAQEVGPQGEMRRSLGNFLAYLVTLASQSISLRGTRMTVVIDGKAVRQRVLLILVSNAQLYGPSVPIAPQAQLDDGMLDVYIFKGGNVLDVARHIVMILSGKHLQDPKVECYRAKQVEVRGEDSLPLHTDGDPIGHTPVTITVLPKALRIVVPRWAPSSLFQNGGPGGRKPPSLAQRIAERLRYERERWREEGERLRKDRAHRMRLPPRD